MGFFASWDVGLSLPLSFGLQSGVAVVADDFIGLPDMLGAIQLFDAALFIFEDEDVAVAVGTLPHTLRQPLLDDFESHSLILRFDGFKESSEYTDCFSIFEFDLMKISTMES